MFFPEKRDFFIEGQGIFDFAGVQAGNSPGDVPLLFFSRQIGLSQGQVVPVVGGVRLTGRAGAFSVGALNIQTEEKLSAGALATNFTALRLKRNLLRRSNVGVMATRRGPALGPLAGSGAASYTAGVDATMLFFKSINFTSYYAMTSRPDSRGDNATGSSYRGRFEYNADRYGASAEHMLIDADFRPEVGYVRRSDIRRSFGQLRFSPRPRNSESIRKFTFQAASITSPMRRRSSCRASEAFGLFRIEFQSSDQFSTEYSHEYELLPARFAIAPGVIVPAGGYTYSTSRVSYSLGQQRQVSGRLSASTGTFYGGTKSDVSYPGDGA